MKYSATFFTMTRQRVCPFFVCSCSVESLVKNLCLILKKSRLFSYCFHRFFVIVIFCRFQKKSYGKYSYVKIFYRFQKSIKSFTCGSVYWSLACEINLYSRVTAANQSLRYIIPSFYTPITRSLEYHKDTVLRIEITSIYSPRYTGLHRGERLISLAFLN